MTDEPLPRRDVLRGLAAGVLAAVSGIGGGAPGKAYASTPKRGGRIRVAGVSSSTADTLDPAKGALSTDYVRLNMIYSGLTEFDSTLTAQPALAEEIHDSGVRELYQLHGASDPMAFLIGSEVYHNLEQVVDRFDDVADEISSVVLDHV